MSRCLCLFLSSFLSCEYRLVKINFADGLDFPCGSAGIESACNEGDLGLIPGLGRSPGGGHSNPLQYSCLENPHGQRSLVGYGSWGNRESDMTERLSTAHVSMSGFVPSCWAVVLHGEVIWLPSSSQGIF